MVKGKQKAWKTTCINFFSILQKKYQSNHHRPKKEKKQNKILLNFFALILWFYVDFSLSFLSFSCYIVFSVFEVFTALNLALG